MKNTMPTMTNHPSFGLSAGDYSGNRLMTYDGEGRELGAYTIAQATEKWGAVNVAVEINDDGIKTITVNVEGESVAS